VQIRNGKAANLADAVNISDEKKVSRSQSRQKKPQ
jgi:hypothetical protein